MTWNDGGALIHGYAESEILGKHFSVFYPPSEQIAEKTENELRIAQENGSYREEGWRVKKGGSLSWANVVLTALFNDQNKLIGYSKVTRDLTERKMNEQALQESSNLYKRLVDELSVANSELSVVNRELEQIYRNRFPRPERTRAYRAELLALSAGQCH